MNNQLFFVNTRHRSVFEEIMNGWESNPGRDYIATYYIFSWIIASGQWTTLRDYLPDNTNIEIEDILRSNGYRVLSSGYRRLLRLALHLYNGWAHELEDCNCSKEVTKTISSEFMLDELFTSLDAYLSSVAIQGIIIRFGFVPVIYGQYKCWDEIY